MSMKDFTILSKLGEGSYSTVYKVRRIINGDTYALKKVKLPDLSEKEKQNALNEVRLLASIHHGNVIQYKEAFSSESSQSLCIIMEFADNGDLYEKIIEYQKKGCFMDEDEIWSIFIQIVKGLKALHDMKIYHRDMKTANIFMNSDKTVKLGDMNVSKVAKKALLYTQTGTPYYASPEVWNDKPYDSKSDIWSLGCVLYEMTTLKPPFRADDMAGLFKKVTKGQYPKIPPQYSPALNKIIKSLLQVEPHLRPTCDTILSLNYVVSRMEEKVWVESNEGSNFLLQTIRIPKNMHFLTERMPQPNYSPLKMVKIDRNKYIQTLSTISQIKSDENFQLPFISRRNEDLSVNHTRDQSLLSKRNNQESKHDQQSSQLSLQDLKKLVDPNTKKRPNLNQNKKLRLMKDSDPLQQNKIPAQKQYIDIEGDGKSINTKALTNFYNQNSGQKHTYQYQLEDILMINKQNENYRLPSIKQNNSENQKSLIRILQSVDLLQELKNKYRKKKITLI